MVDGRAVEDHEVARRVHARRHGPHHVAPGTDIDVRVDRDEDLGHGELRQQRPEAHHRAPRLAGVALVDGQHRDAVGAGFGREPNVEDFGKLLPEQRLENVEHGIADDRWLVGGAAGERGQIHARLADAHVLQAEYRERLGRIVIAGVVAERAFHRGFRGRDGAFEHDLRAGRHMQRDGAAGRKLGPPPAQEAGKGKLTDAFRRGHDGGEDGGGIGADDHGHGGFEPARGPLPVVGRAAAHRQPAHDRRVLVQHLHAVDAEIVG